MADSSMVIRVYADLAKLREGMAAGKFEIHGLAATVEQLQKNFTRHSARLVEDAHNISAAIARIGPAALTASDSARSLKVLEAAMAQLRAAGQPIPPLMAQTAAQLHQLHPAATAAASGLTAVKTLLGSLGVTLGVGALVLGVKRFVSSLFEMGDSLTKLHSRSGIAIEDLQVLGTVAMRGGTDLETLIGAINMMQKRVAGDDDSAVRALKFLHVDIAALQTLTPDQWFYTVSKAINAVGDAALRTKLRTDIMGRGASEVADAMVQDFEAARAATVTMSAGTAIAVDNAGEKIELWFRNLKNVLAELVAGFFSQAARLGDLALMALDKMLAGFYGKMGTLLTWMGKLPIMPGGTAAVLTGLGAEAKTTSQWYVDAAKAVELAMEREAVAALSAAAGTGKASASLDGLSKAGDKAAAEVAKIRDHMYGRDAMKQLETWGAAIGDLNKIAGLAPAIQDEWRAAVEKAEKALGKMTPELKRFADVIPLVSRAIELSQMTRAPAGVTGWPALTSWAASQPGYASVSSSGIPPLPSTDLSGMLWTLPGVYTGNMRAGVLKAGQEAQRATTTFTGALDDLSRAFAELAQVADGDMAKAVRAIGTMITTMQVASQAAASTRGILWNAETSTWQTPQGAGQYAQLAANTVAMYAAMQQATSSTSRAQNIWSGAGTGAQIGGGIMPGWGHLIGAGIGALWGGLSRAPEQAAKDLRDAYIKSAGGLAELNKQAVAAGSGLEMLLRQTDVEGVQWHIDNINRQLAEFAKRLQDAVIPLARISAKGGLLGPFEIQALVRDAITPEIRAALESFFVSETQRGISGIAQIVAQTTAVTAKSAPGLAGAVVAYWAGMEAQGLSLLQMLDSLGPTIATLQEKFAAAGVSGGAAFDAIAKIVTNTLDPAVRAALESATGYNAVLETLFNTGQLTQEIYGGLAAGLTEQYDELIRQGVPITEAARLLQRPLQTVWQLQQQYKWVLDAGTQALLDRAIEAGLVGEQFRPAADRMVSAIDSLILTLQTLTSAILGQSGAEAPPSEPGEGTAITRPGLRGINPPPWEAWPWWGAELPPVEGWEAHAGGLITAQGIRPWVTAHGGALLGALDRSYALMARLPRAHGGLTLTSDEVPFIGLRGERVLSREQTRAYDRGQTAGSLPPIQIVVKTYLDGRQIAEAVVPEIPAVVRRYGLS